MAETPIAQLEVLIQHLGTALLPWLDNRPFVFFGHSLGGLISFELARWLRYCQRPTPELLLVSAARAPHLSATEPPIHQLSRGDFIAQLRRYSGTPEVILENAELMELLLPTLRADFALLETYCYRPQAPLPCAIAAFWGDRDGIVSPEEVESWRIHTEKTFSLEKVAGDHFFVHQPQFLQLIAAKLALKDRYQEQ